MAHDIRAFSMQKTSRNLTRALRYLPLSLIHNTDVVDEMTPPRDHNAR